MTSPSKSKINVTTTTCMVNSIIGEFEKLNNSAVIYVDKIIMATLKKLFATKIVAKRLLGSFNSL